MDKCRHYWLNTWDDRYHRINICAKCGCIDDRGIDIDMIELLKYPKPPQGFCIPFDDSGDDDPDEEVCPAFVI